MGKRRIERKIEELEHGDDGSHILILYEDDDGTVRNADGEPVTEEMYESATVVLSTSEGILQTWPDVNDDDGDTEAVQS